MKITRSRLVNLIKEELSALDEIYWSQVGVRPRSSDGSMGLAKYPGEWAAGRKFVLVEDDDEDDNIDEEVDADPRDMPPEYK